MALNVPKLKFQNGNEIPAFGLGTWKSRPGEVTEAVKYAIDVGYRHIDCATAYENEKEVGAAIKAKIAEGKVKREDLFVTGKVWNNSHKYELVEPALRSTLSDLGLSYVDLYLIHWPYAYRAGPELFPKNAEGNPDIDTDVDYLETWRGMESVLAKGLTKNIGVCNFNSEQVDRLLANCKVKPVAIQMECHPYLNQKRLSDFCKQRGLVVIAFSPLGSPDRPWAKPDDPKLMDDKSLIEVGKKYKKTPVQVLIRYQIDRGHAVIPKSTIKSEILENAQIFDFKLSAEDIAYINTLDCNGRICPQFGCEWNPLYPFNIPF
ncbi:hypothetical protein QAD02_015917 [Eretmocerus hayati]|uniref:Uncharacterized protein n=1 Tax=Eretmocerus hayati TaxID=131215 RepID=A0ACC2PED0_9HYME|nr:hypothetical protein QAD02_015917 [Eretmocerus hayati]